MQSDTKSAVLFEYQKSTGKDCLANPDLQLYAFPHLLPFQLSMTCTRRLHRYEVVYACSDTFCIKIMGMVEDQRLEGLSILV